MKQINLRKEGETADIYENCSIWTQNKKLCWLWYATANNYVISNDGGNTEQEFETEEEAETDAHAKIAEFINKGFFIEERSVPLPPEEPSRPKKVAVKPRWFELLSEPLRAQHAKLVKTAKAKGLAHRFAEIEELMRPGIMFSLKKATSDDLKQAKSRMGGTPDLPAEQKWPDWNGAPLTFVAQVLISDEIKSFDVQDFLPKAGLLSFFAQLDPNIPEYGDKCVILYSERINDLIGTTPPSEAYILKKTRLLVPKPRLTVPPGETPSIEGLDLNRDEYGAYADGLFRGPIPEGRHHTLLGWGTATTQHEIKNKRFLAQFDSDHHLDFEMGDYNTLRFYIDGNVVNTSTLKSAVCTLSDA